MSKDEDREQISFAHDGNSTICENDARHIDGIRITAQLIDATAGPHIWAEWYDRDLTDIFAVQDEITECVAGAIEPELLQIAGRAAIGRMENLDACDIVRQVCGISRARHTPVRIEWLRTESTAANPQRKIERTSECLQNAMLGPALVLPCLNGFDRRQLARNYSSPWLRTFVLPRIAPVNAFSWCIEPAPPLLSS